MSTQNIKKKFEVHPYEGSDVDKDGMVTRTVHNFDKKLRTFVTEKIKEPAGYMVYTPGGNSVRIKNDSELQRLGFGGNPDLIDMETGEVVGPADTSLKSHSERTTHRSKPKTLQAAL